MQVLGELSLSVPLSEALLRSSISIYGLQAASEYVGYLFMSWSGLELLTFRVVSGRSTDCATVHHLWRHVPYGFTAV